MRSLGVLGVLLLLAGCLAPPSESGTADPDAGARAAPPVRFALGPDAAQGPFVSYATLAPDASSFSAGLRVVAEATTRMDALLRLENVGDRPATARLAADPVDDARVSAARLLVGGSHVDLLRQALPTPTLTVQLGPGEALDVGIEIAVRDAPAGATLPTWTISLDTSGN